MCFFRAMSKLNPMKWLLYCIVVLNKIQNLPGANLITRWKKVDFKDSFFVKKKICWCKVGVVKVILQTNLIWSLVRKGSTFVVQKPFWWKAHMQFSLRGLVRVKPFDIMKLCKGVGHLPLNNFEIETKVYPFNTLNLKIPSHKVWQGGRSWQAFGKRKKCFNSFVGRVFANSRQNVVFSRITKIATKR